MAGWEFPFKRQTIRSCKSCGSPMNKPEDFGTNAFGSKSKEYCHYCFQNGKFIKTIRAR
ncbi:MAG: zinc ribbon domain-containing protein [Candidatus Methanoperedens sp.]|nr:zinc ribbon domain-containing protein [Candidatus Methanoperedens sp.]MCZ7403378.1 zinc ribbon domain-containing protein [Candidatus Methanoperedens sp.]